jgi:nucleoside 2-deoxyribosyltransferase
MKKVYLAGPDVFRPDAKEHGERLKKLCAENRLEGLYPLDNEIPESDDSRAATALAIYKANIELLKQADGVVANMMPFRGPSMDIGTGFETGFAAGYEAGYNAAVLLMLKELATTALAACDAGKTPHTPFFPFNKKPIVGYTPNFDEYKVKNQACKSSVWDIQDLSLWNVEDFGLPDNLMVWCSPVDITRSFEQAVQIMARILNV